MTEETTLVQTVTWSRFFPTPSICFVYSDGPISVEPSCDCSSEKRSPSSTIKDLELMSLKLEKRVTDNEAKGSRWQNWPKMWC